MSECNKKVIVDLDRVIKKNTLVQQKPYVGEDGIYFPTEEFVPEGYASTYRCLITKELFVEAFNKWIKNKEV